MNVTCGGVSATVGEKSRKKTDKAFSVSSETRQVFYVVCLVERPVYRRLFDFLFTSWVFCFSFFAYVLSWLQKCYLTDIDENVGVDLICVNVYSC